MKKSFDLYTRTNQTILDGCAFAVAFIAAYLIRFEGWPTGPDLSQLIIWLPILVCARLAIYRACGIYRQIWRFVSFSDALSIMKAIAIGSAALLGLRLLYPGTNAFAAWIRLPLSVIVLEGLASLTLCMGIRALRRILYMYQRKTAAAGSESMKRILLYGAGRAGIMLRVELENSGAYDVIGFVDDDPYKVGSLVCGTQVVGCGDDLERLVPKYNIDEIFISMATASQETISRVFSKCLPAKVPARIIPSVREIVDAQADADQPLKLQNGTDAGEDSGTFSSRVILNERRQKNVLVVGGAGYIGSIVSRELLAREYRVRVLDSLIYGDGGIRELRQRPDFEVIEGDSRSVEAVVRACRDMGAVIHLGAIVGDAACALEPSRTVEINLAATKMIADICKGYGVSRLLFASTCSVYGASDDIVDEESASNPISLYASTKLDSESILLNAATEGFHPTVLRLATAFGTSYRLRFDLVVNLLTIKALTEKRITLHGGSQWRPFIHVYDIARAFILCLESPLEIVSRQIFNAGSDDLTFTIAELGQIICNLIPGVKIDYMSEGDKRNYRVSFEKIRNQLGFDCVKNIEDAVLEIKQLYDASVIGDYHDRHYSNYDFLKTHNAEDFAYAQGVNIPIAATLKSLAEMKGTLTKSQSA
jgi:nucleoside-diphosphate-sugar epimerase